MNRFKPTIIIIFVLLLVISPVNAGFFSDLFNKIFDSPSKAIGIVQPEEKDTVEPTSKENNKNGVSSSRASSSTVRNSKNSCNEEWLCDGKYRYYQDSNCNKRSKSYCFKC